MDREILLAFIIAQIDKKISSEMSNHSKRTLRGPRGTSGTDGADGRDGIDGKNGRDGKDFSISVHGETIKSWIEEASLTFDKLSDEEKESLRGHSGQNGRDGKSFVFDENAESINLLIENHFNQLKPDLQLTFDKLTDEQKELLRGQIGPRGHDGKGFSFGENSEEIVKIISGEIDKLKPDLQLTFDKLTDEERKSLRGQDGRKGNDGRNFVLSEHEDSINKFIVDYISEIRPDLKLNFKDLTTDEIFALRGPRGQKGRDGKSFIFEEHKDYFDSLVPKFADFTEEEVDKLKLKFEMLSPDELEKISLKFDQLTPEQKDSLRGYRGQRGKSGRDGIDGKNGKNGINGLNGKDGRNGLNGRDGFNGLNGGVGVDAPKITSVDVSKVGNSAFKLIFNFSDGTSLETEKITMPTGGGGGMIFSAASAPSQDSIGPVRLTNLTIGDKLIWNGSYWENQTEDILSTSKINLDKVDATLTYIGYAVPNTANNAASWRIKRIVSDGESLTVTWADGDLLFNNVWDNRADLTYN